MRVAKSGEDGVSRSFTWVSLSLSSPFPSILSIEKEQCLGFAGELGGDLSLMCGLSIPVLPNDGASTVAMDAGSCVWKRVGATATGKPGS